MSKRIRELERMALDYAADTHADSGRGGVPEFNRLFADKFAELIIGCAIDCVRDVLREDGSDLTYKAATQVQTRIHEYFK